MDSNRLNRWLTLGANIGVLVGIILLVIELDQNREMIRAQTRNEISSQIVERLERQAANSQLISIRRRGEAGEEFTADESLQYVLFFTARHRSWENIHYQYRQGLFDEDEFTAERNVWQVLVGDDQSFTNYWCPIRQWFSPGYVVEIESLLEGNVCVATQRE